ncbi:MAG: hypothetical protein KDA78_15120, partial [Planctomycetaceae bacterium]|nr:hypothetical protein [Planctomycetaceae bacterium]
MTIRSHSSHWLILTFVFLIAGCQNETPEPEQSESSFEKSAPMPVAEALDGQPEISISTLRKRLGADSRAEFTKASGRIVAANLARSGVTDLSPLEGLPLKYLDLTQLNIDSIAALKGMPLEELYLEGTQVSDLSPLAGMPLKILRTEQCPITDISPLQGMKLEQLGLFGTKVTDLSAIAGMPLNTL